MTHDLLKEKALANFELLLDLWGVKWKDVGNGEYDFLSPTRADRNHGACRFNIEKGWGADFAGTNRFTDADYEEFGVGFDKTDFSSSDLDGVSQKSGFDIIGLCARIYGGLTYKDGARRLRTDLHTLQDANPRFIKVSADAVVIRKERIKRKNERNIVYVKNIWQSCENISLKGSAAEIYFANRGISLSPEPNIRFHTAVRHYGAQENLPCILFNVQVQPDGPQVALHRIFIRRDGSGKADVPNPKMAMAKISGAGIWFGRPGPVLVVCEGPENALTARYVCEDPFVVCTINAINFSALTIPDYVTDVILMPDEDEAGTIAAKKALHNYLKQNKLIRIRYVNWEAQWQKKKI